MRQVIHDAGLNVDLDTWVIRAELSDSYEMKSTSLEPPLIKQPTDDNFESYSSFNLGKRAARQYLSSKNPVTAFLCFNDDIAYGFINHAVKNGINIPDDVSVMGIDGIYLREWMDKKVTTVSINPENIGAMATNVLIDILEGKKSRYMNWTQPRLLEGETVKDCRFNKANG